MYFIYYNCYDYRVVYLNVKLFFIKFVVNVGQNSDQRLLLPPSRNKSIARIVLGQTFPYLTKFIKKYKKI